MPKRWCISPGCRQLFDADSTGTLRCPACQATATARRNARPSGSARGLGWAFSARKARDQAYQQATHCQCPGAPRCALHTGVCGAAFTAENPKTADHLQPRSQGGGNGPVIAACRRCNSSAGGRLAHA